MDTVKEEKITEGYRGKKIVLTVPILPGEARMEGPIYRMKRYHSGGEINLGSK